VLGRARPSAFAVFDRPQEHRDLQFYGARIAAYRGSPPRHRRLVPLRAEHRPRRPCGERKGVERPALALLAGHSAFMPARSNGLLDVPSELT
jgi:hypothetical protein